MISFMTCTGFLTPKMLSMGGTPMGHLLGGADVCVCVYQRTKHFILPGRLLIKNRSKSLQIEGIFLLGFFFWGGG